MQYDIAIIGAGSGGLTSAYTALGFGKKVLLIDKQLPGGECTWSGCIPSKTLINEAKRVHMASQVVGPIEYDTAKAMNAVKDVIAKVYDGESIEKLQSDGIDFLKGQARFISQNELVVEGNKIKAKKFIIATGSSPVNIQIDGVDEAYFLDNESLFQLQSLPKSLIIIGGGAIGVEMAQAMNRLGVKVELVEMSDRILHREEALYSGRLEKILEEEGVRLHVSSKIVRGRSDQTGISLEITKDNGIKTINGERILVAVGRKPNTYGLGLDEAGVKYDDRRILVNDRMQTSQKNIYAVGDVAGPYQFSHMANVQGIQAVQNAIFPLQRRVKDDHVAWVTFSEPELARAGMTEAEARRKYGDKIRVYSFDFDKLDRAMTGGASQEGVKIILDKRGRVLGASIFADRAGELISEIQVIKTMGKKFSKLAGVIHPYPTYSEVFNKIAKKVAVDNILENPIVKIFRK